MITTIAGTDFVFSSDGKPSLDAPLGGITGVAVGPRGNLFVADCENHIVVKVGSAGVLNIVAGNGIPGSSGDGGPATSASLSLPLPGAPQYRTPRAPAAPAPKPSGRSANPEQRKQLGQRGEDNLDLRVVAA